MKYTSDEREILLIDYKKIDERKLELMEKYMNFHYVCNESKEFALQGLLRRISILNKCIHNIFLVCPVGQEEKPPIHLLDDARINLQAFVVNVFGCLDNIAWIWVYEKHPDFQKTRNQVGLTSKNKKLRKTFSNSFQEYLEGKGEWFKYIQDYRDSLGHRIPLYIPPFELGNKETQIYIEIEEQKMKCTDLNKLSELESKQEKLGHFVPWMLYSFKESPILFHPQVLADWSTIAELSDKFFDELQNSTMS